MKGKGFLILISTALLGLASCGCSGDNTSSSSSASSSASISSSNPSSSVPSSSEPSSSSSTPSSSQSSSSSSSSEPYSSSQEHQHTFSDKWTYDSDDHWHSATCGHDAKGDFGPHAYTEKVIAPTYDSEGITIYTCETCGYSFFEKTADKLEHHYSADWSYNEAKHYHACTDAGYESLKIDEADHVFQETVVEPTYEHGGYTEHICETCGYAYRDKETDPLGHHYSEAWTHDETKHWHACTDVGYEDLKGSEANHSFNDVVTAPTFETSGYTTHTCETCGYSYVDSQTAPLAHNYSDEWTHNETKHWHACTDEGYEDLKSDEADHDFKDVVTEPTYEAGGYTTHTCETCGYSYVDGQTNPLDHHYSEEWTHNQTQHWHACTDVGYEELTTQPQNHSFKDTVVEPTFEHEGYVEHTCEVCGYSYRDQETPALDHHYSESWSRDGLTHWHACTDAGYELLRGSEAAHSFQVTVVGPTFEHDGYTDHVCEVCGYSFQDNIVPALIHQYSDEWSYGASTHYHACTDEGYEYLKVDEADHVFQETVVEPTYEHGGYTEHICETCGYAYRDKETDPLGHHYSEAWTHDETKHWHACTDVGYEDLKGSEANHSFNDVVTAPTFETSGYTTHTCETCGYSYVDSQTAPLAHNYSDEWTHNETKHWHACTDEGYEDLKSDEADHDFKDVVTEPTYEAGGYTTHTCETCGYSYVDGQTNPLNHHYSESWSHDDSTHWHACTDVGYESLKADEAAHTFSDWVVTIEPTFSTEGKKVKTCTVCGHEIEETIPATGAPYIANLILEEYEDGYKVTGLVDSDVDTVYIPEKYNDKYILAIIEQAFYLNSSIETFVCDAPLTLIGESAFEGCTGLTSFTIPSTIVTIGSRAFKDCANLVEIINLSALDIAAGSSEHGYVAYNALIMLNNESLKGKVAIDGDFTLYQPANEESWTLIRYTGNANEVVIPSNVAKIAESVFANKTNITSVTFPNVLTEIGANAFKGCTGLTSVTLPSSITNLGMGVFAECRAITSFAAGSMPRLFSTLFGAEDYLDMVPVPQIGTTYYLPAGLTSLTVGGTMYNGAFKKLTNITSVTVLEGTTAIPSNLFEGCTGLVSITLPEGLISIGSEAFISTPIKTITLPESLLEIGDSAFDGCSDLIEVVNLSNITINRGSVNNGNVGYYAYRIINDEDLKGTFASDENYRYYYYGGSFKVLLSYLGNATDLVIDNSFTAIGPGAFKDNNTIETLTIGSNMNEIAAYAFKNCSALTDVIFNGANCITLGQAFKNCHALDSLTIGSAVTVISENLFKGLTVGALNYNAINLTSGSFAIAGTTSITVGSGVQTIPQHLFESISATAVYWNTNAFALPNQASSYSLFASTLASVTFGAGVTTVPSYIFNVTNLSSVNFGEVVTIGEYAFANAGFTTLTIPSGITSIGSYAFANNSSLVTLYMNAALSGSGDHLFHDCVALRNVTWNSNVAGNNLFYVGSGSQTIAINNVVFGAEITAIPDYLFKNIATITSIVIPDSVLVIGIESFANCVGLTSITIPANVTTIASGSFAGTHIATVNWNAVHASYANGEANQFNRETLTTVVFGDGVQYVPAIGFMDYTNLTSVTIPDTVVEIGVNAFSGCTATNFTVNSATTHEVVLPDSIHTISANAFNGCSSITSIALPDHEELYVGEAAFANCEAVTSISIPDCGIMFSESVFNGSSLVTTLSIVNSDTTFKNGSLSGLGGLTSITLPFVGKAVDVAAGSNALFGFVFGTTEYEGATLVDQKYSVNKQTGYYIPTDLTTVVIGGGSLHYGAFYGCSGLTNVTFDNGITSIGDYAFYGCSGLAKLNSDTNNKFDLTGITSIGAGAFEGCVLVANVTLVGGLTAIQNNTFKGCTSLTAISMPNTVTSVGDYAFANDSALASVSFSNHLQTIGAYAFSKCKITGTVTLPNTVTSISAYAFENNSKITTLTVNSGAIADDAFKGCSSIEALNIGANVTSLGKAFDGVGFGLRLHLYTTNFSLTNDNKMRNIFGSFLYGVEFENGVTSIPNEFMRGCSDLRYVQAASSVTSIGKDAFRDCNLISSVTLDPYAVTNYGGAGGFRLYYAFNKDDGENAFPSTLNTIYVDSNIVPAYFLQYGTMAKELHLRTQATEIRDHAFDGCTSLQKVFPVSAGTIALTRIGDYAFNGCTSLANFYYISDTPTSSYHAPNHLASIGDHAFAGCSSLYYFFGDTPRALIIPATVTSIGEYAFSGPSQMQRVTYYPAADATIGDHAFDGSTGLTRAYLTPETGVSLDIGDYAFRGCTNLNEASFMPTKESSIGNYAFQGCSSMYVFGNGGANRFTLSEYVISIGAYAFDGVGNINTLVWQELASPRSNLESVGDYGLACFTGVSSITLPSTLTHLGEGALSRAGSLTSITLPFVGSGEGTTPFGYIFGTDSYSGSYEAGDYYVPTSLTTITVNVSGEIVLPDDAFNGMNKVTTINLNGTVTAIGDRAFYGCSKLTPIVVPNTVTSIGSNAFYGCNALTSLTLPFLGPSATAEANRTMGYLFGTSGYPSGLTTITISGGSLDEGAFQNMSQLVRVNLPEGLSSIPASAFEGCSNLVKMNSDEYLAVPSLVTYIGANAFKGCSSITIVDLPDGLTLIADGLFQGATSIDRINGRAPGVFALPDAVTSIGDDAFNGVSGLVHVVLPAALQTVATDAFRGCENLAHVYYRGSSSQWNNLSKPEGLTPESYNVTVFNIYVRSASKLYDWVGDNLVVYGIAWDQHDHYGVYDTVSSGLYDDDHRLLFVFFVDLTNYRNPAEVVLCYRDKVPSKPDTIPEGESVKYRVTFGDWHGDFHGQQRFSNND